MTHGASLGPGHVVPVVLGPGGEPFAIDHHHLARALHEEGVKALPITVAADASALSPDAFWAFLAARSWGRRIDASGRRIDYLAMPATVADLPDDPYRSLAGALRRAGGFAKSGAPFGEFHWADRLRSQVDPNLVRDNFDAALAQALRYARSIHDRSHEESLCA